MREWNSHEATFPASLMSVFMTRCFLHVRKSLVHRLGAYDSGCIPGRFELALKGVSCVEAMEYNTFKETLLDALTAYDLQTSVDEAVFLNTHSRGCEIFVHRSDEPREVWGKLGFEWVAANQALYERMREIEGDVSEESALTDPGVEVLIHASFHLHFGLLPIGPEAMREAAVDINRVGELFFGEDGGVVAEVSMTATDARLECLRYEVNTSAPLVVQDAWWDQLAEVYVSMLDKLQEIFERMNYEFGSPRDVID